MAKWIKGDVEIAYRDMGDGPMVVLLHGFGGSPSNWREVSEELSSDCRVIVPQLSHLYFSKEPRTFSRQIQILAQFFRELDPKQIGIHLVGHSYGGTLAWAMKCVNPEAFPTVSLVNPMPPDPLPQLRSSLLQMILRLPHNVYLVYSFLALPFGRVLLQMLSEVFRIEKKSINIKMLKGRKLKFISQVLVRFSWIVKHEIWSMWKRDLRKTKTPIHILYSEEDPLIQPESYIEFANFLPHGERQAVPSEGHTLPRSNPQEVTQFIYKILDQHFQKCPVLRVNSQKKAS